MGDVGKRQPPAHGTVRRYRLELKDGTVCAMCRSANSKAKAEEREARKVRSAHPSLSIVPDPQSEPTVPPTAPLPQPAAAAAATTESTVSALGFDGIQNAVRNLLNSAPPAELLTHVYGEIVIVLAKAISTADPKDIPKLTEEMVAAAKLMQRESGGGEHDIFSGFGAPR